MKWLLGLIDGPIISKVAGVVVGFICTFYTNAHYPLTPQQQTALLVGVTGLIEKGIQIGSAYQGNAVTSTIPANAHSGDQ